MRYAQHRSSVRRRPAKRGSAKRFFSLAFLLVIGLGGYSVWSINSKTIPTTVENTAPISAQEIEGQLKEVTEKVVALAIPSSVDAAEEAVPAVDPVLAPVVIETGEVIELTYLESGDGYSTTVKRDLIDGQFVLSALANLPFVDDATATYEIWLVKPGVTDFFSVGNMYRREDGRWGLVWKVDPQAYEKNVRDFTRVIVTREPRDGVTSPSTAHVMQGDFTQP